jgi:hypothetical protein
MATMSNDDNDNAPDFDARFSAVERQPTKPTAAFPQGPAAFPNISTQPPPARSGFKKILDELGLTGPKPAY